MTVMVQTTTNYNAAGEIVSVIVFRVPVEDKMKPSDAQIEALIAALEPFAKIEIPPNADDGTWVATTLFCNNQITASQVRQARAACNAKISFDAALTAAAEVGTRDLTPQEQQLMHGALMASSIELRSRIEIAATIERCAKVVDNFKFLPEHSKGVQAIVAMTIAAAIRALLKEKP